MNLRFLLSALIFSLSSLSALADTYQVQNVSEDSVLNVRDNPSLEANIIGTLKAATDNIVSTGKSLKFENQYWIQIEFQEKAAWVSGHYLSRQQFTGTLPETFRCGGTEPFWNFTVTKDVAQFTEMNGGKATYKIEETKSALGQPSINIAKGTEQETNTPVTILFNKTRQCSDGMSDFTYDHHITLIPDEGPAYAGCCGGQ